MRVRHFRLVSSKEKSACDKKTRLLSRCDKVQLSKVMTTRKYRDKKENTIKGQSISHKKIQLLVIPTKVKVLYSSPKYFFDPCANKLQRSNFLKKKMTYSFSFHHLVQQTICLIGIKSVQVKRIIRKQPRKSGIRVTM